MFEGHRKYNCARCRAPIKIVRRGSHPTNDPDSYEFDGVDLSPTECRELLDILYTAGPLAHGLYEKIERRSKEILQPGRQYETRTA